MMEYIDVLKLWSALGEAMRNSRQDEEWQRLKRKVAMETPFFTEENLQQSVEEWGRNLQLSTLLDFVSAYPFLEEQHKANRPLAKVAVVMAGNLPLVGFHDMLMVLLSSCSVQVKMSSNDNRVLPFWLDRLHQIHDFYKSRIEFCETRVGHFDAVIATGSGNTSRYFDYYFGRYPHIIRRNRNSLAVLTGKETEEELRLLGEDIYAYFGLGCRSVSLLLVPKGYVFNTLFEQHSAYQKLLDISFYKNNYDYRKAIYLIDRQPHLDTSYSLFVPSDQLASPISVVHYREYGSEEEVNAFIAARLENLQCVIGNHPHAIPFGHGQKPELNDFADRIDTVEFVHTFLKERIGVG